jgi:hypothetical protein
MVYESLSQKYSTQNRTGVVAQMIAHLPGKREALSSNPSTTKKRKKWNRDLTARKRRVQASYGTHQHQNSVLTAAPEDCGWVAWHLASPAVKPHTLAFLPPSVAGRCQKGLECPHVSLIPAPSPSSLRKPVSLGML